MDETVRTKDVGLAAYLRINNVPLIGREGRILIFKTNKSLADWRMQYMGSEASRHDAEVLAIKKLITGE